MTKSGKRKREISAEDLGAERETGKRKRTKIEGPPSDRVLRSDVAKNAPKKESKSKSKEKNFKQIGTKEKKPKAKSKDNEKSVSKTKTGRKSKK